MPSPDRKKISKHNKKKDKLSSHRSTSKHKSKKKVKIKFRLYRNNHVLQVGIEKRKKITKENLRIHQYSPY